MKDILVVDDDSTILEVIRRILERGGIKAHCVSNGEDALEKLRERNFPMMITDFDMPGLNGLELSRRGLELAPDMRIIMDTGGISDKDAILAREIGIARILAKPFLPKEMLDTIWDVMDEKVSLCS